MGGAEDRRIIARASIIYYNILFSTRRGRIDVIVIGGHCNSEICDSAAVYSLKLNVTSVTFYCKNVGLSFALYFFIQKRYCSKIPIRYTAAITNPISERHRYKVHRNPVVVNRNVLKGIA